MCTACNTQKILPSRVCLKLVYTDDSIVLNKTFVKLILDYNCYYKLIIMNAVTEQLTELCHAVVQLKISIESYDVISTIMNVAT